MGLIGSSPDGALVVEFYDDPRQTLGASPVSVRYTVTEATPQRVAFDFWCYVSKVLYNLGEGEAAIMLRGVVAQAINAGITKNTNVLECSLYHLTLVEPRAGATKRCEATFFPNNPPQTSFSWGGEEFYAPMSCFAFLQHIVNNLHLDHLPAFEGFLRKLVNDDKPHPARPVPHPPAPAKPAPPAPRLMEIATAPRLLWCAGSIALFVLLVQAGVKNPLVGWIVIINAGAAVSPFVRWAWRILNTPIG